MNFAAGADSVLARIRAIVAAGSVRGRADPPPSRGEDDGGDRPVLRAAAPNPLRDGTVLVFRLPRPGRVLLTVHDVAGRRVASLLDAPRDAGEHRVHWNATDGSGRDVASGLYFARLRTGAGQSVVRLQVVR
jgi:hypothetical protein